MARSCMSRTGWFKHLVRLSAPWCVIAISQIAHNVPFCGPGIVFSRYLRSAKLGIPRARSTQELRGMVAFSPKITRMEKLSFHMVVTGKNSIVAFSLRALVFCRAARHAAASCHHSLATTLLRVMVLAVEIQCQHGGDASLQQLMMNSIR